MRALLFMLAVASQQPPVRVFPASVVALVAEDISGLSGVPAGLLVAVAEHESGFKTTARRGRCCGLGQVDQRYSVFTCAEMRSVNVSMLAEAIALKYWLRRTGNWHDALQCYATGNACTGTVYADKVIDRWNALTH